MSSAAAVVAVTKAKWSDNDTKIFFSTLSSSWFISYSYIHVWMMRGACVVSGSVIIPYDICVQRDFCG